MRFMHTIIVVVFLGLGHLDILVSLMRLLLDLCQRSFGRGEAINGFAHSRRGREGGAGAREAHMASEREGRCDWRVVVGRRRRE